jgi:hypothetical protein
VEDSIYQHREEPGEVRRTVTDKPLVKIRRPLLLLLSPLSFLELLLELFPHFDPVSISTLEECINDEDENVKDDI